MSAERGVDGRTKGRRACVYSIILKSMIEKHSRPRGVFFASRCCIRKPPYAIEHSVAVLRNAEGGIIMSFFEKFKNSAKELSNVHVLAICAMMLALRVVLGIFTNFTLAIMPFVKIGFSFIPIVITAYLFGPVCAGIVSGAGDILSIIISNPTAFSINPLLTLCYVFEGVIYGVALYKSELELKRIILAKVAVLLLCALPLNTLILSGMMNIPYPTLLLYRAAVLVPFGAVEVIIIRLMKPLLKRIKIQKHIA